MTACCFRSRKEIVGCKLLFETTQQWLSSFFRIQIKPFTQGISSKTNQMHKSDLFVFSCLCILVHSSDLNEEGNGTELIW